MNLESRMQLLKTMISEQGADRKAKRERGYLHSSDGDIPASAARIPLVAGNLIEVLGPARWRWAAQFFQQRSDERIAWVSAGGLEPFPPALAQHRIALSRILFLEKIVGEEGVGIVLTLLESGLFQTVVFESVHLPRRNQDANLRKLQLKGEEAGCLFLMLSERPTSSFGISIQIETEARAGGIHTHLKKVKGGTSYE